MGGRGRFISGCGWVTGGGHYLIVVFFWVFLFMLLSFVFSCPVSLFLSDWSIVAVVSYCLLFLLFVSVPLTRIYQ